MKTIVRAAGNIGPFDEIEVLADRLRCYRNGAEDYLHEAALADQLLHPEQRGGTPDGAFPQADAPGGGGGGAGHRL